MTDDDIRAEMAKSDRTELEETIIHLMHNLNQVESDALVLLIKNQACEARLRTMPYIRSLN